MNPNTRVKDGLALYGRFISITLVTDKPKERVNAFDFMMNNRLDVKAKLYYPPKVATESDRKDWKLFNDLVGMMEARKYGFRMEATAKEDGKRFVGVLRDALWYILPHLKKMKERCGPFPDLFTFLLTDSNTLEQEYNVPEKHRHLPSKLENTKLEEAIQSLYGQVLNPVFMNPQLESCISGVKQLIKWLETYKSYLDKTEKAMKLLHKAENPARTFSDIQLKHIASKLGREDVGRYLDLEGALNNTDPYKEIDLQDYLPTDRRKRYFFIADLSMPFPISYLNYPCGGPHQSIHFVWRRDSEAVNSKAENIIQERIKENLPLYHTRAMRREFLSQVQLISANTKGAAAIALYQKLTGDKTVLGKESTGVQERLRIIIDTQDVELVGDMRELNKGRESGFREFWQEAQAFINEEQMDAVNDRRHGTVCHKAVAMSIPDLKRRVAARLPEGTKIPSDQTIALAFLPRNKYANSASNYTGILNLRFQIQRRQLSVNHPDGQYCATLYHFLKNYAVKYMKHATLVCVDDKALVPVGEPGVPLAPLPRSKSAVVADGVPLMSSDHDTDTKCKVTPSTTLIVDIPDSPSDSFCRGQVVSILKDTILQPSTPLRHTAELDQVLSREDKTQPILLMYADGGGDHNITFPSVQLALMALFLMRDLDVLIAVRCCPGRSFTNPAEKAHCVMNIGLQSVALERDEMPEAFEIKMKKLTTMKKIRAAAQENTKFGEALLKSTKPCRDVIADQFKELSLKETKFKVYKSATEDQMDRAWSYLSNIDSELEKVCKNNLNDLVL